MALCKSINKTLSFSLSQWEETLVKTIEKAKWTVSDGIMAVNDLFCRGAEEFPSDDEYEIKWSKEQSGEQFS